MVDHVFDHYRRDVYRLSIEYVAESFRLAKGLSGLHRHTRDQWLRAAQSIPLIIAEGNGKPSLKDRCRSFAIARGSALECAAVQDVLAVSGGIGAAANWEGKKRRKRIVAMLTRMVWRFKALPDRSLGDAATIEHEHEHRFAEHEDWDSDRRTAR